MKLGAEQKKLAILGGLLVVAAVIFMINSGGDSSTPQAARTPAATPGGIAAGPQRAAETRSLRANSRASTEFRPSMRPRRGEERADPMNIDPTLRLDVLAKLQDVKVEGTRRSIFDFSQPPDPKVDPKQVAAAKTEVPSPLVKTEEKPASETPEKPKAPPIPLKFYGYISRVNVPAKRAFFMDGEEIHVAAEGDLLKKRYKIVRIGINSVIVEDTQFGQEQTLPLEEQPG